MLPRILLVLALSLSQGLAPSSRAVDDDAHVVVFASGRSANGDLYVIESPGAEPRLLAGTAAPEGSPRWDGARARLVYQRFPADGEEGPTWLVAHTAGAEPDAGVPLFEDPNGDAAPRWSPDGKWIAFIAEHDGRTDVFVAAADGSGERRLTDDDVVDRYPAWDPESRHLVFARQLASGWDLFTLDVGDPDAEPVRRTEEGRYVGHPAWSADGRFLAFDTVFEGDVEIAALELESGEIRRLTRRPGNDLVPSWSPDGMRVVFGGVSPSDGNWDVYEVEVDSGEIQRLTTDPAFDGAPLYVPVSMLGP